MKTLEWADAYYPTFQLGHEPSAIPCVLSVIEANDGRRYFKTPFAMLGATAGALDRALTPGGGYYRTAEECRAYLAEAYPWHEQARPIMDALAASYRHHGAIVGPCCVADRLGVSLDDLHTLARGARRHSQQAVKRAAARLLTPAQS